MWEYFSQNNLTLQTATLKRSGDLLNSSCQFSSFALVSDPTVVWTILLFREPLAAMGVVRMWQPVSEAIVNLKNIMAAPKEVSVYAAIAWVESELESISSLEDEQKTALRGFRNGKDVFTLFLTDLSKRSKTWVNHKNLSSCNVGCT